MSNDVWTYRGTMVMEPNVDVSGYDVEATDGSIGKVDEATYDTGRSYLVVDTGPWIFGKKVMLPAGVVRDIDESGRRSSSTGRRTRSSMLPSTTSRVPTTSTGDSSARTTTPRVTPAATRRTRA